MQWTGKALDEQIEKFLITLDKNKSGAMTWEKDPTFEYHDLLCVLQHIFFIIIQLSHFVVSFTHW